MKFLFIAAIAFSSQAFASSQCLQEASNQELLNELSYRMNGTSNPLPNPAGYLVAATCQSWNLQLTFTDLEKGVEQSLTINNGTSDSCLEIASLVNTKVGSQPLNKSVLIASCTSWNLKRVLVHPVNGLKELPTKNLGTSDKCLVERNRINGQL